MAKLLGRPDLTQNQIAEIVGLTPGWVSQTKKLINQAVGNTHELELESYRRSLRKKVSEERRVDSLATIISPEHANSNPFSVVRAIEYVDTVLGLHPKVQQLEEIANKQPAQPVFIMPTGTNVQVNLYQHGQEEDE